MLHSLITERIIVLQDEASALAPDENLQIVKMSDPDFIRRSAGGAATADSMGNMTIHIDLNRATEYILAHELMHVILHRSGWPQMYTMISGDMEGKRLADDIDNLVDHVVMHGRLFDMGFNVNEYRENMVNGFSPTFDFPAPKMA